jgi:tetratricopeptide (TPR) repeat protein
MTIGPRETARELCATAEEALGEAAFRTGDFSPAERLFTQAQTLAARDGDREAEAGDAAGTARALFGVGLVLQVLRRDWAAAMTYFWPAYGLAEALEESGDLYARSEIHRHLGFHYLFADVRPAEAVRQQRHSLALRERLGDPRRIPSALVALGEAEIAAGNPPGAVELLRRAAGLARGAGLLPWRIEDAERSLAEAEAALAASR